MRKRESLETRRSRNLATKYVVLPPPPIHSRLNTVEPPNNGQVGDGHFVHCSEVVPPSEVEMYVGRGEQYVHCREVVNSSECPLSEVPL